MYDTSLMSMGKRKRDRQPLMWVQTTDLPPVVSHPFYQRLNQLLRQQGFDDFVEAQCAGFYAEIMGRPGLPPGIYFRLLLIGDFEGINAERGIAWVLRCLGGAGLIKGKTIGLDATTLEAKCRHAQHRPTRHGRKLRRVSEAIAKASGIGTPTRADLARLDRKRKKKASNDDWTHPHDPDAKITKMKDGRTAKRQAFGRRLLPPRGSGPAQWGRGDGTRRSKWNRFGTYLEPKIESTPTITRKR